MNKKILALLLAFVMVVGMLPMTALAADSFSDMDGHWSQDAVSRWAEVNVLNGDDQGNFNPEKSMTRAEFAQMLCNLMGYTEKAENTFSDVPDDAWYADAILKLNAAGVMSGVGGGLAAPDAPISREQAAVLLCRALNIKPSQNASISFGDAHEVSDWARDAVAATAEVTDVTVSAPKAETSISGTVSNVAVTETATGSNVTASGGSADIKASGAEVKNDGADKVTVDGNKDVASGDTMPYVLKSLTVTGPGAAEATDIKSAKTFTMDTEGTYTVTAEFYQPITKAALFIVKDEASYTMLEDYGYSSENATYEKTSITTKPWLALCATKAEGDYTLDGTITLTANGQNVTWPHSSNLYSWATAYVNAKDDTDVEDADKLSLTGSAYTFVATFNYGGAHYEFTCDYTKPGVEADNIHTIKFGSQEFKAAQGEKVTAPAGPEVANKYFTGWKPTTGEIVAAGAEVIVGETDVTYTAQYVDIETATVSTRPAGPAQGTAGTAYSGDFDYKTTYEAAGMTYASNTITINAAKLAHYVAEKSQTDAANPEHLKYISVNQGGNNYVMYGVQFPKVADAAKAYFKTDDSAAPTMPTTWATTDFTEVGLATDDENSFNGAYVNYIAAGSYTTQGSVTFNGDVTRNYLVVYTDSSNNVIAIQRATIERKVVEGLDTAGYINLTVKPYDCEPTVANGAPAYVTSVLLKSGDIPTDKNSHSNVFELGKNNLNFALTLTTEDGKFKSSVKDISGWTNWTDENSLWWNLHNTGWSNAIGDEATQVTFIFQEKEGSANYYAKIDVPGKNDLSSLDGLILNPVGGFGDKTEPTEENKYSVSSTEPTE